MKPCKQITEIPIHWTGENECCGKILFDKPVIFDIGDTLTLSVTIVCDTETGELNIAQSDKPVEPVKRA